MSNNVPQNHPHVQAMVRKIEFEYKNYIKERSRLIGNINNATNELYKEQFNFNPHGNLID